MLESSSNTINSGPNLVEAPTMTKSSSSTAKTKSSLSTIMTKSNQTQLRPSPVQTQLKVN